MKPLLISKVMRIPRSLMRGIFIVPIMICLIAWPCWAQEGRATPSKTTFINVSPLYYLASGAYAGLAVRPTWYAMIEKASGGKSTYSTLYVTPKAGYRWFPFNRTMAMNFGIDFNLITWDRGRQTLGGTQYSGKRLVGLPNIVVGAKF